MKVDHAKTPRYVRETEVLAERDPVLAGIVRTIGPCTLAPARSHFLALVEAVIWQQLSWKAALAIRERFLDALGARRPRPEDIAGLSSRSLAKAGLSRQKTRYVKEVARYFEEGRFCARKVQRMTDDEIVVELTQIKGVGRWTAEMYLIFGLNRLDVFPAGDLGLKKAIGRWYGFDGLRETERVDAVARQWRPYRTIGTWYMWSSADATPPAAPFPRMPNRGQS